MSESIDLVFGFDVTGSMAPAIFQVKRDVENTIKELFKTIPNLRVGICTIADYCDGAGLFNKLDLTTNQNDICNFIKKAQASGGGDSPEAYEYALNKVREFSWSAGKNKAFVLIADDEPHEVGYRYGSITNKIDWKNEAKLLVEAGVNIYSIQALGSSRTEKFYEQLANIGGTPKLDLAQFGQVVQLLQAICYKQSNKLSEFEALLRAKATSTIDLSLLSNLDKLAGRKVLVKKEKRVDGLVPVHPSRFQIIRVDSKSGKKVPIKDVVQDNGLTFKTGRGFYEFTKTEEVQEKKEVVVQDRSSGDMFTGVDARNMIGLPFGTRGKVKPEFNNKYRIFIQSTSNNRALVPNTNFLYEVEGL